MKWGLGLAALVVLLGFGGPLFVGDPDATNFAAQLAAPGAEHWLGTDAAGRDVLTRTLVATRSSLADALTVAGATMLLGLLIGGVAGYYRGWLDAVLSRVIDVMLGFPDLVIALAIVGALGVGRVNLLLALVVTQGGVLDRVTRALVLAAHSRLDVAAARMAGVGDARVLLTHVLAHVLVLSATGFGAVVLSLAGLSFIGLGAQPSTAQLGQMLADSRGDLAIVPWLAIGPAVMIALTVAVAMLGSEALRDALSVTRPVPRSPGGHDAPQLRCPPARLGSERGKVG
ncbi:ABC transporter permease [Cryptosporangium sp. NPDC048952]|uniref:ABC transporter permease n=1 Tax=Cryptosporangium sp. NPDC048952 TaxID=3363961 RepID=UPI003723DA40